MPPFADTQLSRDNSLLNTRNLKLESVVRSLSSQTSALQSQIFAMEEDRRGYEITIQSLRDELRVSKNSTPLNISNNFANDVTNDMTGDMTGDMMGDTTGGNSLAFSSFCHLGLEDTTNSPWAGGSKIIAGDSGTNKTREDDFPLLSNALPMFGNGKVSSRNGGGDRNLALHVPSSQFN